MFIGYELDRVFKRHNIGYTYLHYPDGLRVWREKGLECIVIGVPHRVNHRFQKFWQKAVERLGSDLEVYYIQHGLPMEQNITELETLYFIKKESASRMLYDFYEILIPELDE